MRHLPFNKPGRFWRGNLHTHSTRSDGRLSPEAVCKFYQEMGYDFISITDHFMAQYKYPITDTRPLRTETFTTLLGAELHAGTTTNGELWHILAVGLPPDFAPNLTDEDGPGIAARAMAAGAFVSVAHPAWYALSEQDVIALGDVHAIETINGISFDHNDRIDSWYMLDVMVDRGRRYFALTTDDAHFHAKHNDLLRGWTYVKSERLDPDSILTALKNGYYYNSTGAQIHDIQMEGEMLYVRCSPASSLFLTGKGSRSQYIHGNGLIEAEFNWKRLNSPHCRLTVRQADGGRAWTNPMFL
jgi:histidinol phosphatase-like PHP family hydrolase